MNKQLIVAATAFEVLPLMEYLKAEYEEIGHNWYERGEESVMVLITGVGIANTAFYLGKYLDKSLFERTINVGIAGAFDMDTELGSVHEIVTEQYADLGVQLADGSFQDLFSLGLLTENEFPYSNKVLKNTNAHFPTLTKANAITVQKVHGYQPDINTIKTSYPVQLESMEGAAFFQACLLEGMNFAAVRAVSNHVEPRNRSNWKIAEAIDNLNQFIIHQILIQK